MHRKSSPRGGEVADENPSGLRSPQAAVPGLARELLVADVGWVPNYGVVAGLGVEGEEVPDLDLGSATGCGHQPGGLAGAGVMQLDAG